MEKPLDKQQSCFVGKFSLLYPFIFLGNIFCHIISFIGSLSLCFYFPNRLCSVPTLSLAIPFPCLAAAPYSELISNACFTSFKSSSHHLSRNRLLCSLSDFWLLLTIPVEYVETLASSLSNPPSLTHLEAYLGERDCHFGSRPHFSQVNIAQRRHKLFYFRVHVKVFMLISTVKCVR